MGATSLIPLFMSLALLSKTALDLTQWGEGKKALSRSDRGRWRNKHKAKNHQQWYGSEFATHQVNLADFYREEKKNTDHSSQSQQIQSRKLYLDDYDQIALESQNTLSLDNIDAVDPFDHDVTKVKDVTPIVIDDLETQNRVKSLEDQIAMESVNRHLKKMSQIPSRLKDALQSDLIRKLTSVVPEPYIVTSKTTPRPEILIKHRGSPTPVGSYSKTNSIESRLNPDDWNKSITPRKAIRFSTRDEKVEESKQMDTKQERYQKKKDKVMSTLKPKLKSILQKYASTTIDPLELIKKYKKSLKSTTLPPNISRKYPTKYVVGDSKESDTDAENEILSDTSMEYTTSSSFRYKGETTKPATTKLTTKKFHRSSTFGDRLFTTEEITLKPTVTGVKPNYESDKGNPLPPSIVTSEITNLQNQAIPDSYNIKESQKRKSFHSTLVPVKLHKVSIAPRTNLMLDDYYNTNVMGIQRRRIPLIKNKSKGLGQSFKDLFFPNNPSRRIIKVKKPKRKSLFTTMKPVYTTLKAIQNKFPSILIDPYKQMKKNTENSMQEDSFRKRQGLQEEEESTYDFPYKFHKPITSFGNQYLMTDDGTRDIEENSRSGTLPNENLSIDDKLLSPTDAGPDLQNALKTYLPALISIGTGLGIALHTLLNTWDKHIKRDMMPSLVWSGDEVTITYDATDNRDLELGAGDMIPIVIDEEGNVNLGSSEGSTKGYKMKDPDLAQIIMNLLPPNKKEDLDSLKIHMDKYVFFRVILTYLYNSSMEYLN